MNTTFPKIAIVGASLAAFAIVWVGINAASPDENNLFAGEAYAAERAVIIPAPRIDAPEKGNRAVAIFAGGCFWGVEGVFEHTKGVISAVSGYHGGGKRSASYKLVSAGMTDHAEAVRVIYDPDVISYGQLMQIFFSVVHDPTMMNAQGPDRGKHYRSALIPMNKAQAKAARVYLAQLNAGKYWNRPIVTTVEAYKAFYPAETNHQDFMQKNPRNGYILRWDKPKLANLKKHFSAKYRAKPVS
ncbi:peptide-methionine (S)-S-oxide reductase MsrA [Parasphingorhabdus sp. JC815]|uniref:peptide-methionine (S)-S-oxide reductase MsrA n=1 Tax=Parasphingorhabdus sp. JC815 TaxID=3232140 RepID=UPI0034593E7E